MTCLLALFGGDVETVDAKAGAYRIAEFMHLIFAVLTKKK
jgi:hypothetical protein